MNPQQPTGAYQLPPQYSPYPQAGPQPPHRAAAAIAPGVVLVFIAWHALMVLMVAGAGKDQSWDTTFDIFGIWAAVDVMLAAGVGLWKLTARRNEPAPRG